jgi:hypothetical protein
MSTTVVDMIVLGLEKGMGQGVVEIGPGLCTFIRDVAKCVVSISSKQISIEYDTSKQEGERCLGAKLCPLDPMCELMVPGGQSRLHESIACSCDDCLGRLRHQGLCDPQWRHPQRPREVIFDCTGGIRRVDVLLGHRAGGEKCSYRWIW